MQERSYKRGMGLKRVQHPGAYSSCDVRAAAACHGARMPPRRIPAHAVATKASAVRRVRAGVWSQGTRVSVSVLALEGY